MSDGRPIGVFDSGVGGFTVVRALRARLPHESILYLGDTARVPYGTKSPEVVRRYAVSCARLLAAHGAKAIVIACNTASAVAVDAVAEALALPVLGVIEPGAALAAKGSSGRIGVIGTEGTIRSGRYQALIGAVRPGAAIFARPCPLLVPLAEEGMTAHAATLLIAREYLAPLLAERIDTLVLGCTHYPILQATLQEVCGPEVHLIDSATAVAEAVALLLRDRGAAASVASAGATLRVFATDVGERFDRVGRIFLGEDLGPVEWVDV